MCIYLHSAKTHKNCLLVHAAVCFIIDMNKHYHIFRIINCSFFHSMAGGAIYNPENTVNESFSLFEPKILKDGAGHKSISQVFKLKLTKILKR